MEIKEGARVYTVDGKQAGKVHRVVIDPGTKEITHLVVQKGFLLASDKVMPIDLIQYQKDDGLILRPDAGNLDDLPDYVEREYVPLAEAELANRLYTPSDFTPPLYWYPAYGAPALGTVGLPVTGSSVVPVGEHLNIPGDTVPLSEGAKVIGSDGKHVGNLNEVLMSSESNQATHLMISTGLLSKEKKLIPISWVSKMEEDQIHLKVGSRQIDQLPKYEGNS